MTTSRKSVSSADLVSELRPGQSVELLKELHILTRDGAMNADSRRKLKQVYHLYQLVEPHLRRSFAGTSAGAAETEGALVDLGAGKSYLGFILYDLFFRAAPASRLLAVESRPELIEKSAALARKFSFDRMDWVAGTIREAIPKIAASTKVRMVTALHACDTATDDAIDFAFAHDADTVVLVPCCQARLADELKRNSSRGDGMSELWKHPIHRREFGSHLTNVLRCLRLAASGYHVVTTELVGWEHSMKSECIIAERKGAPLPEHKAALESFLDRFPISNEERSRYAPRTPTA